MTDWEWEKELLLKREQRKRDVERFLWLCATFSMAALLGLAVAATGKGVCQMIS